MPDIRSPRSMGVEPKPNECVEFLEPRGAYHDIHARLFPPPGGIDFRYLLHPDKQVADTQ